MKSSRLLWRRGRTPTSLISRRLSPSVNIKSSYLGERLRLSHASDALEQQRIHPATYAELGFEERLGLILDHEIVNRDQTKIQRLKRQAKLRLSASGNQLDYRPERGLKRWSIKNETRGHISRNTHFFQINSGRSQHAAKRLLGEAVLHLLVTDQYSPLIETCKKRGLSAMSVLSEIITAVVAKRPYPNVFDL
ncbi:IstB-like ATP-binding domain-containing protein [Vibrio sp. SG41-7]|uniref:ATP-binding protein n=1 Tax=Vibrio sp. SG41-7 TaxID=2760973 RepID=UPI0016022184|nr:IstB-like ATP-binding domain-containing protein [Vibrio sp. SG41-7]